MRINGKEITHNEYMTGSQIDYLHARIKSLVNNLENKGYDVSYDKSGMSEATYLTINNQTVSFRNHDYFSGVPRAEYTVWLSHFETWTEAKKHFFNIVLAKINGEEVEEKQEEKKEETIEEQIAYAQSRIDEITGNSINDQALKQIFENQIKRLKAQA